MKPYFLVCALALASCAGNGEKKSDTTANVSGDTTAKSEMKAPAQNMDYCFIRKEGTSNQDTTAVHLLLKGDKVTGEMKWLPKEKDSRKGTLNGTLTGNQIKAVWSFMQEGMKDSMNVAFKLSGQELAQKPFKVNAADGRQITDDAAGYTLTYKLDNCSQFKTAGKPAM